MAVRSRGGGRAPGEETCEAHCSNCDLELKKETVKQTEQLAGDRGKPSMNRPSACGMKALLFLCKGQSSTSTASGGASHL
eukprot:scaffold52064_cov19-Tisochrysis_lutea.AAC.1